MRLLAVVLGLVCSTLIACRPQPTYVECESGRESCDGACVDLATDFEHCGACDNACALDAVCDVGTCVPLNMPNACAINNGGCALDAMCMDIGGVAACACNPGFVGDGVTDLETQGHVDLFVGVGGVVARPAVAAPAQVFVTAKTLAPVLAHVLTDRELARLDEDAAWAPLLAAARA